MKQINTIPRLYQKSHFYMEELLPLPMAVGRPCLEYACTRNMDWNWGRFRKDYQEKEQQPILGMMTTNLGWLSVPSQAGEGIRLLSVTLFGLVHLRQKITVENKELAKCWHKNTFIPQAHLGWKLECFQLENWSFGTLFQYELRGKSTTTEFH